MRIGFAQQEDRFEVAIQRIEEGLRDVAKKEAVLF
jgi:hypothetical protein